MAKEAILQVVRDQIDSPEAPYVREAYDRLLAEGHPEDEVMKLLGCVLTVEFWEMANLGREFDEPLYKERLAGLPDLGWLDDDD